MKTKTTAWLFGLLNLVIVFVMIIGLLGTTPLRSAQASPGLDTEPADFDPAGMPSDDVQHHPYTLPDSAARFKRSTPAAERALATSYRPHRLSSVLEEAEQPALPAFFPPAAPAWITADVDYAFAVDPFYDVLWSWGFPANTDITLTVGTDTYVRTSNEYGEYEWSDLGHDFVVGELITITSGVFTKSHKVQKLSLTDLNQELDIVKGTAKPGTVVVVGALYEDNWYETSTTTNTEGVFKAKMGLIGIDLVPGLPGNIGRWESDGDGTVINWTVGASHIRVYPDHSIIRGFEWWPSTMIDVKIDGVYYASLLSDPWGYVQFFDITKPLTPGVVVQMTDGKTTRTHTITPMSFDLIDVDNDRVEGTGVPGLVSTYAWSPGYDEEWVDTIADASGKWATEYVMDIGPGSEIGARQFDSEGNRSVYYWYLPNPSFTVNLNGNYIWASEWTPGNQVTVSVDGSEIPATIVQPDGHFSFDTPDILPGQVVIASDGVSTKTLLVTSISVTSMDADLDTITGTAAPNSEIYVDGIDEPIQANASGVWTGHFAWDLLPGSEGLARQYDEDNDWTEFGWRVPDPWIAVNYHDRYVWCDQWPTNTSVTLFIDDVEISTIDLDYWGDGGFWDVESEVGQEVTVTGGGFTKSTIVTNISLGGVDQYADTVFGTANPGSELKIWAWNEFDDSDGGAMYTTTDSSGNWLIDFSENWDIKPGWYGYAQIHEPDDSDFTEVYWNIPMPWMRVYIALDEICAYQWTPGSVVTITVDDYSNTMTANEYGEFCSGYVGFDLVPGDYVEMTDGFTTKSHTTYDIVLSGYDLDLDTLYGTTEPFSWIHGAACNNGECNDSFYDESIGASGEWLLDFSGIVDIQPGTEGWIDKGDDDNDYTFIDWRIPRPRFNVNIVEDYVWCGGWASFAELTLNIDGIDVETATANFRGGVGFWGYDIQPGQTVKVRHGMYEKTHLVNNLEVTAVDPLSDTISGTADLGSVLDVRVNHSSGFENVYPVVQADRTWTADFSGIWDIVPGNDGYARLLDEDGDNTEVTWRVPKPWLVVGPEEDFARGHDVVPGATVTLKIGTYSGSLVDDDYDGYVYFDLASVPFDILPGQTAELSDGTTTMTHTVRNIAFTGHDLTTDKVSGTATAGSDVLVYAFDAVDDGSGVWATADSEGKWTADFQGLEDISVGTWGWVDQHDDEGDYTTVNWHIPAPIYPAYQEKLTTSKVTLDWEDVPDATAYKIQLSTKADFSILLLSATSVDSIYPYSTKLANNTTFYWRVKAKVGGVWGSWLPVWQFTSMDPLARPILQNPAPKVVITEDTPTLDWDPVVNGVQYLVQISKVVDFSTTYFKATTSETEFETNPLPNGKYFWRIRALDASGGKGPWSEVRMFKIAIP